MRLLTPEMAAPMSASVCRIRKKGQYVRPNVWNAEGEEEEDGGVFSVARAATEKIGTPERCVTGDVAFVSPSLLSRLALSYAAASEPGGRVSPASVARATHVVAPEPRPGARAGRRAPDVRESPAREDVSLAGDGNELRVAIVIGPAITAIVARLGFTARPVDGTRRRGTRACFASGARTGGSCASPL